MSQLESASVTICADRLITPNQAISDGWVRVSGGLIADLGSSEPPREHEPRIVLPAGSTIVPGLVDQHVHGGGGADMTGGDPAAVRAAAAWHAQHGTTSMIASLVTAPLPRLEHALDTLSPLVGEMSTDRATILGTHLEGPFLSPQRRGAHPRAALQNPSNRAVQRLVSAARGTIRMVTIAPELPGALDALTLLREEGVVVAVGHTDASWQTTMDFIEAGATVGTHLFNGMRPIHHREPGPAIALLSQPAVTCELINDGTHVHPDMCRLALALAGARRLSLITDAVAATGAPDGAYPLGEAMVIRRNGQQQLADGSSLGGGVATLAAAVQRAVTTIGAPLITAVTSATVVPATALGVADRAGLIAPGRRADLVVLDAGLAVIGVMIGGRWKRHPHPDRTSAIG